MQGGFAAAAIESLYLHKSRSAVTMYRQPGNENNDTEQKRDNFLPVDVIVEKKFSGALRENKLFAMTPTSNVSVVENTVKILLRIRQSPVQS